MNLSLRSRYFVYYFSLLRSRQKVFCGFSIKISFSAGLINIFLKNKGRGLLCHKYIFQIKVEQIEDGLDRHRSHSLGCYQGDLAPPSHPAPIGVMSPERLRSLSTGDQPVGQSQPVPSSQLPTAQAFQPPSVPTAQSSLRDVPINSRMETLRSRLSQAASGPTQLWLFLLELLLTNPDQKCIQWTKRGWEFLMGKSPNILRE